jgi:hypothetical protein
LALIPHIETQWVCIAQKGSTLLAAQLSSHFNKANTYFPIFFFYAADRPFDEASEANKDGYFSQVIWRRAATQINNSLAHIQPHRIILLGMTEIAQTHLRAILPEEKLIVVNNGEEMLALPFISSQEPLRCKPTQPIQALAAAKATRRPLVFDEHAPDLPDRQIGGKAGLVVLENNEDVVEVAAVNYAAAIDADVAIVEPIDRRQLFSLPKHLAEWAQDRSSPALKDTRRKILDRVRGIDFSAYKFATFFTAGLPYGLILENQIPFSHMQNGPFCGLVIANTMAEEYIDPTGSALLFSLGEFEADETQGVEESLASNNFETTVLLGENATNENLTEYGSYLPYDILHICSHGGETDGYFLKKTFLDRDGKEHTVEIFEIVSATPALDPEKVSIERKIIPASLNGIPWSDQPLGLYPDYVGDDLWKALRDANDIRTPVDVPIALSCHIKCHKSIHQGVFDEVACHAHPVVFNNSCSSSHELASCFLGAGARAYLATLWNIGSTTAKNAAVVFYATVLGGEPLLAGFVAMTRSIKAEKYKNNYIFWGLHFSLLRRPALRSDATVLAGLIDSYRILVRKFGKAKEEAFRNRILSTLLFLRYEISRRLPIDRVKQMVGEAPEAERSPQTRNVPREIIFRQEIKKGSSSLK